MKTYPLPHQNEPRLMKNRHHVYCFNFDGTVLCEIVELDDDEVLGYLEERTDCLDNYLMVDAILNAADELRGLPPDYGAEHQYREDGYFDVWLNPR